MQREAIADDLLDALRERLGGRVEAPLRSWMASMVEIGAREVLRSIAAMDERATLLAGLGDITEFGRGVHAEIAVTSRCMSRRTTAAASVHRPPRGPDGGAVRRAACPQSAIPESVSAGAVGVIFTKHATAAGVRDDRRAAHTLRHTSCATLAERGVSLGVIRALAGHIDIRTTQIQVGVTDQRKAEGITALERIRHPLAG